MTSKERLIATLNHQAPDRVCVDFGSISATSICAGAQDKLRKAVLKDQSYRIKIAEVYEMRAEMDDELREAIGIDIIGLLSAKMLMGLSRTNYKPFTLFDGTEVLVPSELDYDLDQNGNMLFYADGDRNYPPSARMPKGGYYFDYLIRQKPIEDDNLNPDDNCEEFSLLTEDDLQYYGKEADRLAKTDKGILLAALPGTSFGDVALVPGVWMKDPKGIRDPEEWYISLITRPDYIFQMFEKECEIALQNIELMANAVGDKVQVAYISGTDFGSQRGLLVSKNTYRDLFKPFHKKVNDRIHELTNWKTLIHSCGSVIELMSDFIEAGFDIFNPVQCNAEGMDPKTLKKGFGKDIVFWGGAADVQGTLAFGSSEEVYRQVRERIEIFNEGGGFVCAPCHNIQENTPLENMLAMFRAIEDSK